MKILKWTILALLAAFIPSLSQAADFLTELRIRGYSMIPAPQKVELGAKDIVVDDTWGVEKSQGVEEFTAKWLNDWAVGLYSLELHGTGPARIILRVTPGTVKGPADPGLDEQGYRLAITENRIEITGNSQAGLFYGVQSLLQLLRRNSSGKLTLPTGTISDWPDLELRFIHWDTKHNQKRIPTLKRILDWTAFFKVNCIGFEMEDKYEYPRHPVIGAPGAYTRAEMQELTAYALERHIQIVPVIQSPAHFAYVLKHPEFAHLRADSSNYQACMCDEEAIKLIFDMYQDMIEATPGVKYFHVSTDEVYYAGICKKCKRPYNEINRSQAWIDFALRAHRFLTERGRRMLAWVEYPLLAKDILQLPPDLINGVMGSDPEFLANQKKIGMRQLAYTPIQGSELLFPNYFSAEYRGRSYEGRLADAERTVREGLALQANPIGSFCAAWDDSGLHEECFWLGWATVTQYAWTYRTPTLAQSVADFMDVFYGQSSPDMVEIYQLLIDGARFFEDGWDNIVSRERGPSYGNSEGKGIGTTRHDLTLGTPSLPAADNLAVEPRFAVKYGKLIEEASGLKKDNERLIGLLSRYITQVERNRYNLEVFLSIAYMEGYFVKTLLELKDAEKSLLAAARADREKDPAAAVAHLTEANNRVRNLLGWGDWMWKNLQITWEKSRFPKNRDVGGKKYLWVMDDVKDHFADRRKGLDYMIAPFQRMELAAWREGLVKIIKEYAAKHNVPIQGLAEERLED